MHRERRRRKVSVPIPGLQRGRDLAALIGDQVALVGATALQFIGFLGNQSKPLP